MKPQHIVAVVDDDMHVRDSLALAISSHGWVPHVYCSGEGLFRAIGEGLMVDCVVLDLDLPTMNGVEVQRRLNASERCIPTVVLTADPHGPMAQSALQQGAALVLGKPATYETLTQGLENALKR